MPTPTPHQPSSFLPNPSAPWSPSERDRCIYQWVKFDGHSQAWVAAQFEINQSTVSRLIDRYERWIARGGPGLDGGLTHDERLRHQRWLTYERNERILASALRIAADMERQIDISHTTITRNNLSPTQESEVKTYHEVLDRSGSAARYLRLAHRINMDQLKLVAQDPLPPLEPLTAAEADDLLIEPPTQHSFPPTSVPTSPPPPHKPHTPAPPVDYLTPDIKEPYDADPLSDKIGPPAYEECYYPPTSGILPAATHSRAQAHIQLPMPLTSG